MFMFGYLEYLWVYPIGYLAFGSVGVFKPKRPVLNLLTHPVLDMGANKLASSVEGRRGSTTLVLTPLYLEGISYALC